MGSARWWRHVSSVVFPQGQSGWGCGLPPESSDVGGPQAGVEGLRGVVRNVGWWTLRVPGDGGEGGWALGFQGLEQWASLLGPASLAAPQRAVWWGVTCAG